MADNVQVNERTTDGAIFAADEISSVYYPRTKIIIGADGVNDGDVSSANPLPVSGTFWQATQPVSLASVPLPTGAATDATLVTIASYLDTEIASAVSLLGTIDADTSALAGCVAGTEVQVDIVSGSVSITGSVAVTGPLTDTQLRASAVAVSAASLPLPTGAATESTLSALNGKVTACNTGAVVLAAGAAIVGSVAIDQTTPGTTNAVVASLAAGQTLATVTTVGAVTTITNVVHVDDNGGALTVDGTVAISGSVAVTGPLTDTQLRASAVPVSAAALPLPTGAATEATLADVKTSVQLIDNAVSGAGFNITQLAGAAVPIGAGTEAAAVRVTIATDSTGTLSVDDGGGALTVDGTVAATQSGTWNVGTVTTVTAVTAITNALPAGTNAIGKLAANSGVDIGDVDVTSVVPGTAATNLGKAEDAGHTSGDVGVMALAVRQDAAAALAGTDADYAPLEVDAIGRLHANATEISGAVYDGTTLCTVKRFMAVCGDGDSLIAAVASKKFRVLSFAAISLSGTIARFWLDDADAAVVLGSATGIALEEDSGAAPPGFVLPHNPHGWFQTATANKSLRVQYASGTGALFFGTYIEVA